MNISLLSHDQILTIMARVYREMVEYFDHTKASYVRLYNVYRRLETEHYRRIYGPEKT